MWMRSSPSVITRAMMRRRAGLAADRLHVVHNGILLDGYTPAARRRSHRRSATWRVSARQRDWRHLSKPIW